MAEQATMRLSWDVPVHGACDVLVVGGGSAGIAAATASARVIPAAYAMGQAAGTAAALCAKEGVAPRDLAGRRLRELLREQGAIV